MFHGMFVYSSGLRREPRQVTKMFHDMKRNELFLAVLDFVPAIVGSQRVSSFDLLFFELLKRAVGGGLWLGVSLYSGQNSTSDAQIVDRVPTMYSPRVQFSPVQSPRGEVRQTNYMGVLQQHQGGASFSSPAHSAMHTPLQSPRRQLAVNQAPLTPRQFQQASHSDMMSRATPPQASPRVMYDRPNYVSNSAPTSHQSSQSTSSNMTTYASPHQQAWSGAIDAASRAAHQQQFPPQHQISTPRGVSYNMSPSSSPSKVAGTGAYTISAPPRPSTSPDSKTQRQGAQAKSEFLESARTPRGSAQAKPDVGAAGAGKTDMERLNNTLAGMQCRLEALTYSSEAEKTMLQSQHRKDVQSLSQNVEALQLVIIDQGDLIEKLRRQNQEQATAGSVADVTALRRELVEINSVYERRIEDEKAVSERLRQELSAVVSRASEQKGGAPFAGGEAQGGGRAEAFAVEAQNLQEQLIRAQGMIDGLQNQLGERIENSLTESQAVLKERQLREAAEQTCAYMTTEHRARMAAVDVGLSAMQAEHVARMTALEEQRLAMEVEHQAKQAALEAMTLDLADLRGDRDGGSAFEVKELRKRSVEDAKNFRAAREKCIELQKLIDKKDGLAARQTDRDQEAAQRAAAAEGEAMLLRANAATLESKVNQLEAKLKGLTEGERLHEHPQVRELLSRVRAEHEEQVKNLRERLDKEHEWMDEILLCSPMSDATDDVAGGVKEGARERVLRRLKTTTDREKFVRLQSRIQEHMQATKAMTTEELSRQVEGLLLAVSAAEAEADHARGQVMALEEERQRLMETLSRAEELSTELSHRCEMEEHERLRRMQEMLRQQKVISDLSTRNASLQAEIKGFESNSALALKRQQIGHSIEIDQIDFKHRVEMSRMSESMQVLKASLGLGLGGGTGSDDPSENAHVAVKLKALQERASWLESEVDSKAAQCGGLMQSNARMEKTIIELQASLSAVGKDLEEMKKSGMYGPHTEASGQYKANFGDVGGGEVSAEPGGVKVFIGPAEAEAKVAELEAQQSALISEMTEQKLMNLRLEEEAAKIRADYQQETGKPWSQSTEKDRASSLFSGVGGTPQSQTLTTEDSPATSQSASTNQAPIARTAPAQ